MDDTPEEDRLLRKEGQLRVHTHEWVDMYGGAGFRRGKPDIFLQSFYCKWCLKIQTKSFNGKQFNKNIPEDDLNEPDYGATV